MEKEETGLSTVFYCCWKQRKWKAVQYLGTAINLQITCFNLACSSTMTKLGGT